MDNSLFSNHRTHLFIIIAIIALGILAGCSSKSKHSSQIDQAKCHTPIQSSYDECYQRTNSITLNEQQFKGASGNIIIQKQCQVQQDNVAHIASLNYFNKKLGIPTILRVDSNGSRQVVFAKKKFETIQLECTGSWKSITRDALSIVSSSGLIPWGNQLSKYVGEGKCEAIRRRYNSYSSSWKKRKNNTIRLLKKNCPSAFQKALAPKSKKSKSKTKKSKKAKKKSSNSFFNIFN